MFRIATRFSPIARAVGGKMTGSSGEDMLGAAEEVADSTEAGRGCGGRAKEVLVWV